MTGADESTQTILTAGIAAAENHDTPAAGSRAYLACPIAARNFVSRARRPTCTTPRGGRLLDDAAECPRQMRLVEQAAAGCNLAESELGA